MTPAMAPQPRQRSAQYIRDLVLASDPDEIEERLALAAIDAIEERDTLGELLGAALEQLHEMSDKLDRARDDNRRYREDMRAARVEQKAAA